MINGKPKISNEDELVAVLEDVAFYKKLATGRYLRVNTGMAAGFDEDLLERFKRNQPLSEDDKKIVSEKRKISESKKTVKIVKKKTTMSLTERLKQLL